MGTVMVRCQGILLGHNTPIRCSSPHGRARTVEDDPGAPFFNDTMNYVVSSTLKDATWRSSTIIGPYDPKTIQRLKEEVGDLRRRQRRAGPRDTRGRVGHPRVSAHAWLRPESCSLKEHPR
jgi:hypothetical protein